MNKKPHENPGSFDRIMLIAFEHMLYWRRNPDRVAETARQMNASPEAVVALAIADQIDDEFNVRPKRG